MVSTGAAIQSRRGLSGGQAPSRQRSLCRRLGRGFVAGDRATATNGKRTRVPGGRGLCQAGDLRSTGGAQGGVCNPHSRQREPGVENRRAAVPAPGKAQPQTTGTLQELLVPGGELDEAEKDRRQGRAP